jgi:ABC-type multidrug transport system fused ATPase/permease subunit
VARGSLGIYWLGHHSRRRNVCHHFGGHTKRTFPGNGWLVHEVRNFPSTFKSVSCLISYSYALQITQSLNWIVRQTVEVETNIVSVERVLEYANLPSEAPDVIFKNRPNLGWPAHGAVKFENYSTRYREGLDLVLKNISLNIKPHEKVGVVGRTGAGKSSLTLGLFRIIEPVSGSIRQVTPIRTG